MSILDELKDNIPTRFANINSRYFEELICELFVDSGYQVKTRRSTGDLGANMILRKENVKTAVQVKKYQRVNLVGVEEVNQAIRGKEYHECDKALFITTSAFDESARKRAKETGVELWNWDRLYSEIKRIYFAPKPCISKSCLEAIKKAYALNFPYSSKRIEAFEKAVALALTKQGRQEIYGDMVNSTLIVDNYKRAVKERIIDLMTHLARLYEGAYQLSKGEGILQQALELNEGSHVAMKAMGDVLLKEGKIDEAIELWKEKIRKGLTADTRWLRDAERKKREGYSFHPKPSTIEELETLIDQGIIPTEQYDYRKKNIIEKQQRRKLEKIRALDTKKKEVEAQTLHKYYSITDVSVLHKDCCNLSCRRMLGKKPESPKEIPEPKYYPSYERLPPEQRWIYHEWLKNKRTIIGIGYVFVRLAELMEMLFHKNYDKDDVRNEMKFLLELYRDNRSFVGYGLEALRLSYFVEQKQFSQEWIVDMTQSAVPLVSPLFFSNCGLDYKWGIEVPQELKRYLHELIDKYKEEVDFCNLIFNRLAETYYAFGEYEKALFAIKSISKSGHIPIEITIEIRYKLKQSLEGDELLIAAGTNNNYYYYANRKKITKTVEGHAGKGDWIEVENPLKAEITYHFTDFTIEHFDVIAVRCEKKIRKWEENQGRSLLQYITEIYDEDPSFTSSGHNFISAKEFVELVAKIAYEAENEIRGEMSYPPIGKPGLTEAKLYELVKSVFEGYEVVSHARPSFLRRQHLDIYIPELKLAIEYQGEQHFKPIDFWGGVESLKASQKRDENKREVCERHGIVITYFSYKDEVNRELIRHRLKDYL